MIFATAIAEMSFTEIIKNVVDIGIEPVLLIVFIWYFIQRDKSRDKLMETERKNAQIQIENANKLANEREDMLILNNVKREEMIRDEAAKREKIVRQEAEKRENALIYNMGEMSKSISKISDTMTDINKSMNGMQLNMEKMQLSMKGMQEEINEIKGRRQ